MGFKLKTEMMRKTLLAGLFLLFLSLPGYGLSLIHIWHNYSGLDPEIVDVRTGFDKGTNYPLARKFTLGLTVKF